MKFRSSAVLLATLASAAAWGQEVNVYGATLAQLWKQENAGFDKNTYAPATQFLGVDATNLGSETLSLHLFGWGRLDLADQSRFEGKSGGELTFGYLKYRGGKGNLEVQAGRFFVNQGVSMEQVDGASVRADLIWGFTVSAFGGRPVLQKTLDLATRQEYELQRDVIFGGRLGKRFGKFGELGVSYLQDGTTAAQFLPTANSEDFTRRQVAADLRLTASILDFYGRTVYDVNHHIAAPANTTPNTNKVAEHDYNVGLRFTPMFSLTGNFTERNYRAFYAGTNLPSLFNKWEAGKFKSNGLAFAIGSASSVEAVVDIKKTDRETYGQATRFGGELRWRPKGTHYQAGFGFHRVSADDAVKADAVLVTRYGLSYRELRAWVVGEKGKWSYSADAIHQNFDDKDNPNLNGKTSVYEVVGSVGYKFGENFKISGDLSHGVTPVFQKETRALFRAEYRFGKGGK